MKDLLYVQGLVDWRPITLPGNQPNVEALYNLWAFKLQSRYWPIELVELNDCLYRNLYRHDFIAILDVDEIIMPNRVDNWHQLIQSIEVRFHLTDSILSFLIDLYIFVLYFRKT